MSERYIRRSRAVAARLLGGEMMIMSATDSTLFSLSEVGTVIWQAADGKTPLSSIVKDRICLEFDVAQDEAYRDAESFTEQLASHGILHVSSQPITDDSGATVR
jgi:Coenzyme PQQ synthesis protein D (PqqD)